MNNYINTFSHYPHVNFKCNHLLSQGGKLVVDPTISINLIKHSELPFISPINRNIKHSLFNGEIQTIGSVKILISDLVLNSKTFPIDDLTLDFGVVNYQSGSNIIGVLGAVTLDKIFQIDHFVKRTNHQDGIWGYDAISTRFSNSVVALFESPIIERAIQVLNFNLDE